MIHVFLWGTDPKKLHFASGLPVKVRHIPANLFSQVDDMASDQGVTLVHNVYKFNGPFRPCQAKKKIHFRIFHFFGSNESVPFLDFSFLW